MVLLLCDGDKSSQDRDFEQVKAYWQEYKELGLTLLHTQRFVVGIN